MAKIKQKRIRWKPPINQNIQYYKFYWDIPVLGGVDYDSSSSRLSNSAEVLLPDGVPSFPHIEGTLELGITAVDDMGNESDMNSFSIDIDFVEPDRPSGLLVEDT